MTNIRKVAIGASVLVVIIAALVLALSTLRTGPPNTEVIAQRAEEEKQTILSAMAQGEILYFKAEQYEPVDPTIPAHLPWLHPERVTIEIWMAEDADGVPTLYSDAIRTTDGQLLAYSELQGDKDVSTWVATGEQVVQSRDYTPNQLSGWVRGMWALGSSLLAEGVGRSGSGTLGGEPSAIFETEIEMSSDFALAEMREKYVSPDQLPARVTHVIRQEFVEARPLLLRSRRWERDASGTQILLSDYRVLEYKLLPADTEVSFD